MIWWANKDPLPPLDPQAIKPILKALLDNTKDKNTVVRAYSDQAIVNLLKMRQGEEVFQVGAWAWGLPGCAVLWAIVLQGSFCMVRVSSAPPGVWVWRGRPGPVTGRVPADTFLSSCGVETSSSNGALSSNKISCGTQTSKTGQSGCPVKPRALLTESLPPGHR